MSALEIRHADGRIDVCELAPGTQILVGRLAVSDIQIDQEDVAPIHCRFTHKANSCLLTAATPNGVLCNGINVSSLKLTPGDKVRVGDTLICYMDGRSNSAEQFPGRQARVGGETPLAPRRPAGPADAPRGESPEEVTPLKLPATPVPSPVADSRPSWLPVRETTAVEPPTEPPRATLYVPAQIPSADSAAFASLQQGGSKEDSPGEFVRRPVAKALPEPGPGQSSTFSKFKKSLTGPPRRPGEEELARSPMVLILMGGTLALFLAALTVWFILGREAARKQFTLAETARQNSQFADAISAYEQFIKDFPNDVRVEEARAAIGTATVELLISGRANWQQGLDALNKLVLDNRDRPEFEPEDSPVRGFVRAMALKITRGAAQSADRQGLRPLLLVSDQARDLYDRYQPSAKNEKLVAELADLRRAAEHSVRRKETFDTAIATIDKQLTATQPLEAMQTHKNLLVKYPELATTAGTSKVLRERLGKSAALEQTLDTREPLSREARTDDHAPPAMPLMLARRARERSDVTSAGEVVCVMVEDSCVGLDSMTGEIKFRRVIGLDPPFFPQQVNGRVPGWLLYDSQNGELALIDRRDGKLQWRQPLDCIPVGAPLVHEGQIYLATKPLTEKAPPPALDKAAEENAEKNAEKNPEKIAPQPKAFGQLLQLDFDTGKLSAQVRFSQGIGGPPVLTPEDRMCVVGRENVLYILTRRPLACERVVYLGHGPGGIAAPGLLLRNYLLLAENDRLQSAKLRLLKMVPADQPPVEIPVSVRTSGQVREPCVVRGNVLFVPSRPEQIRAFTVVESDDAKSLVPIAEYRVPSPTPAPMYLSLAADGQMWMASTGLRRFQLTKDVIVPEGKPLAEGICSQPLQAVGQALFVARRLPYSRAVTITEANREQMLSNWQVTLGGTVLALVAQPTPAGPNPSPAATLAVTATGDVFRLNADRLTSGGFEMQPLGALPLPTANRSPLSAAKLADGTLAVWCGGAEPRLFQLGGESPVRPLKLTEPLQAAPVLLAGGWLLPLAGKLKLEFRPTDKPALQDLLVDFAGDAPPAWRGLVPLDATQVLATNASGRVCRVQAIETAVPHLEDVAHWDAEVPVDLPPVLAGGGLVVVDSTPKLTLLDASSLEPLEQIPLPQTATRLSSSGSRVFVELAGQKLLTFAVDAAQRKLTPEPELPLTHGPLAGPPLQRGAETILAFLNGHVAAFDAAGKPVKHVDLRQALAFGPELVGEQVLVGTLDGSLYRVDNLLKAR